MTNKKETIVQTKILLLEDDRANAELIRSLLLLERRFNYCVSHIESINEVYQFKEKEIDLILLDLNLEDMKGIDTYKEVERIFENNIPIIVLTGNKDLSIEKNILKLGAQDYIPKSKLNSFTLNKSIEHSLERFKLVNQLKVLKAGLQKKNHELKKYAETDVLTGLVNRRCFEELLNTTILKYEESEDKFALFYLDIDKFKWINDKHGHDIGDSVLKIFAKKLLSSVKEGDVCARMGGDEFCVLIHSFKSHSNLKKIAQRIIEKVAKTSLINNKNISTTTSIGIATYPDSGIIAGDLFKKADIAMYNAKNLGRCKAVFYEQNIGEQFFNRHELENKLQEAFKNNNLRVFYQPIVEIKNKKIRGLEALLRWNDKELGDVSPDIFIPIAEESGLIHDIGLWVIKEVCQQISQWNKLGVKNIFFAVNISPKQLESEYIEKNISEIMEGYGVSPYHIEFEITETEFDTFMGLKYRNTLLQLRQMHIRISIDDFGKGSSTIDRLCKLPVNTLKIDGEMLKEIDNNKKTKEIIKSIISLSQKLSMDTIAECIETESQANFLIENGCKLGQGFYFYKPMDSKQVTEVLLKETDNSE